MSDLDELDYAVALADGWEPTTAPAHWSCNSQRPLRRGSDYMCWDCMGRRFSRDWTDGGPIIERERIEISFMGAEHGWQAALNPKAQADWQLPWVDGQTPLIAAMRAYVASKFVDKEHP